MANLHRSKTITGWLGLIATALAAICVVALLQARGAHRDADRVNKVHHVIETLKDVLYLSEAIEDRAHDYLRTGSEADFVAYNNTRDTITRGLDELQHATRDDRMQYSDVTAVRHLADQELESLTAAVQARRNRGSKIPALTSSIANQQVEMYNLAVQMEARENNKLRFENAEVRRSVDYVTASYSIMALLIFALLILVFFLINAESAARRRYEAHMEALASTDGLTGLKNRRAFEAKLDEEYQAAARSGSLLSLIMLDVDQFKNYNDSYGHPAGDEVLKTVGRIMREATRNTDFPARYGGEEFAVLVPDADSEKVVTLGERLRAAIEAERWPLRPVTASIGIATLLPSRHIGSALVDAADKALYEAKEQGRNRVVGVMEIGEEPTG